jgi:hypothetical protein
MKWMAGDTNHQQLQYIKTSHTNNAQPVQMNISSQYAILVSLCVHVSLSLYMYMYYYYYYGYYPPPPTSTIAFLANDLPTKTQFEQQQY